MINPIKLTATAKYGYCGKQYIAKILGRDEKFTFNRMFLGTKSGKRKESTEHMTDEPGLYVTCDIDSKGNKDETYYVLEESTDKLVNETCSKEDAMKLAKLLDQHKSFPDACIAVFGKFSCYYKEEQNNYDQLGEAMLM